MSEDTTNDTSSNDNSTSSTSHSRRSKKNEIFGIDRDDLTLGIAATAGIGVLGLATKTVMDMMAEGKLPNPFAPQNPRISYSDVYDQQRQQQEWEAAQRAQAQQQQQHPELSEPEGGDPSAQTMPAYTSPDDFDIEGEQFSTAPPKRDRFNRINTT